MISDIFVSEASTLNFNGSQHLTVTKGGQDEWRTQTEDISLRFRTTRPLGLLLATSSEQSQDRLELAVTGGRVRLTIRLGDREKVSCSIWFLNSSSTDSDLWFQFLQSGQGLNDNQWHTLRYTRRSSSLKLQVDDDTPARGESFCMFFNSFRYICFKAWEIIVRLTILGPF